MFMVGSVMGNIDWVEETIALYLMARRIATVELWVSEKWVTQSNDGDILLFALHVMSGLEI